jgi:hypothetical protein
LITGQDVLRPGLPSQDEDQFSWSEVEPQVEDALRLVEAGKQEAGYLILWIAFERMMRSQARRIALPADRLAPAILNSCGFVAVNFVDRSESAPLLDAFRNLAAGFGSGGILPSIPTEERRAH